MNDWDINYAHAYIMEKAKSIKSINPVAIALHLMLSPEIRMHGPEHHFLSGASLCAAWCNAQKLDALPFLEKLLPRCTLIPPAVCGYYGVCGNTMAIGATVSVMLGITYLSGEEWGLVGSITARAQKKIAGMPGPRCCKRTTMAALYAATDAIRELLGIPLERPKSILCRFSCKNEQCIKKACIFHKEHIEEECNNHSW